MVLLAANVVGNEANVVDVGGDDDVDVDVPTTATLFIWRKHGVPKPYNSAELINFSRTSPSLPNASVFGVGPLLKAGNYVIASVHDQEHQAHARFRRPSVSL